MMKSTGLATATVLVALLAAGCTAATDKSGAETAPRIVVLASHEGTDLSSPAVARFVELVAERSGGRLRIEVSTDWQGLGEQRVLEDVAAGKVELGWSGTRAFDLIGVDAFRPIHAPFLIGSYPAQRAVVADDVAQEMLGDLGGTGLTGLGLLADELRFPVGAEAPLLDVSDYKGLPFGTRPSHAQTAAITALGARAKDMSAPHPPATDGLLGLETQWSTYVVNSQQAFMPFVTANAVLWPRTTAIVANSETLDEMDGDDQDALKQAASQAARWSLDHADDTVDDELTEACADGARIATASPDQLAALAEATQPVYDALRADPEQSIHLARIEGLVRGVDRPDTIQVPEGCAYQPGDEDHLAVRVLPEPLTGPGRPGQLPGGTYRYTLTEDEIRDGVEMNDDAYTGNAGVWTWTLADGRWHYDLKQTAQEAPQGYDEATTCDGYYDVHGDQVDFTTMTTYANEQCASNTWKAEWQQTEDGLLMDVTTDADDLDFLFGAKEWERID